MENSVILEEILEELTENAKHISSSSCIWGWKYSLWENRQHRQLKKKIFLLSVQVQEKLTV